MVFESLFNPAKAERRPLEMILVGFVYCSIAIVLSLFVFQRDSSLVMIFLTVLACSQMIYGTIKMQEEADLLFSERFVLLKEHTRALSFFMMLFFGFVLAFSFWYIVLPQDQSASLFQTQIMDINNINGGYHAGDVTTGIAVFRDIFLNNMMVLGFCILFSLLYGIGAIFILTWNASIIGAAIGSFVRESVHLSYAASVPLALMR